MAVQWCLRDRTQSINLLSGSATDQDVVQQGVPNSVALSALLDYFEHPA